MVREMLKNLMSFLGVYKLYEKWLWYQVKEGEKPEHIAIILDGNRRWASKNKLVPLIGHYYGAKKIKELLTGCLDLGVKSITLYSFSTENFRRTEEEVNEILRVIEEKLREILLDEDIHKHKVRVKIIGRKNLLPKRLQAIISEAEEATKEYDQHFLNVAIAYGGRAEIVDATKKIAQKVKEGVLSPGEIDEAVFEKHLYTAHMPKQDPDLIARTSGEARLSGFLLWQCAYSELCFLDIYWPEFRRIDLLRAVRTYQNRKRRFGK
jgi:tritrans,polycis-undecaprenyl-diphosphate synthase [geranylgeranyl-diphosphate specific]